MSDFKVQKQSVSDADALRFADELERMIGEVMNGRRKPAQLPAEPMIALIQFARNKATEEQSHG